MIVRVGAGSPAADNYVYTDRRNNFSRDILRSFVIAVTGTLETTYSNGLTSGSEGLIEQASEHQTPTENV